MPEDEKFEQYKRESEAESQAIAKVIGIERDFRPLTTIYNSASSTVIALVERCSPELHEQRLFFRNASERRYHPIPTLGADINYNDPVSSPTQPIIYYLVHRSTKWNDGFAGDWLSLDKFDLVQHRGENVVTRSGLRLPSPYARGWISQLFGMAADESAVLCSCGLERPEKGRVHYWACSIDLQTQQVTLFTRLEGVWF